MLILQHLFNISAISLTLLCTSSDFALAQKNCTFADAEELPAWWAVMYRGADIPGVLHLPCRHLAKPTRGVSGVIKSFYIMAARSNTMFNGVQSGRVGSVVGFKRDDSEAPQGIRPYVAPSNPKSAAQSKQRARFAGVSLMMSFLNAIADHNIEGQRVGRWNRRAFSKLLFSTPNTRLLAAKGAQVLALNYDCAVAQSIKISKGSLGKVTPITDATPVALGVLTAESIEEAGLMVGDIITIITGVIGSGNLTGVAYKQYQVAEGTEINDLGLVFADGAWTATMADACFGVIIERNGQTKHLLTTSEFAKLPKFSEENTSKCYETYMANATGLQNNKYLYGEDFEENPNPAAVISMRNLSINGESLAIGGTRQLLTTAALSGSVEVLNLNENQEAVAALGNYAVGDPVIVGSAIGQFGHGQIDFSHAAFGTAGSKQIWLMIDGVAYRKIANLTIVEPPFETSISSLSIDGNVAAKNAQVVVHGQTLSISGSIAQYSSGHSIRVGFNIGHDIPITGTTFEGMLYNVPRNFAGIKLFVDGVEVETYCEVKTDYVAPSGFSNVTINGIGWNSDSTVDTSPSRITGSFAGESDCVLITDAATAPQVGTIITSSRATLDITNGAFSGNLDTSSPEEVMRLIAVTRTANQNQYQVDDVYQYTLRYDTSED